MDDIDTEEEPEIESGPFCRHYGCPTDCEETCDRCGHECHDHDHFGDGCDVEGCECEEFQGTE